MKATDIIQILMLADQIASTVARLVDGIETLNESDLATIKQQIKARRQRNDKLFAQVEARLESITAAKK